MKWCGLIASLLGAWLLKASWYDPVEGEIVRPIAVMVMAGGIVAFFEGLKREIIAGVREKARDSKEK